MAFTYEDPAGSDRDAVRFGLGDTHPASGIFSDAEIAALLTTGGSVAGAINEGLRVLMVAAASKGDANRVAQLQQALTLRGGEVPTIAVTFGGNIPSDDGYETI